MRLGRVYAVINLDWRTWWGEPWCLSLSLNNVGFHKDKLFLGLRLCLLCNKNLARKYADKAFPVIYILIGMSLFDNFLRVHFDKERWTWTMVQAKGGRNLSFLVFGFWFYFGPILHLVIQPSDLFPCSKAKFQFLIIQLALLIYIRCNWEKKKRMF